MYPSKGGGCADASGVACHAPDLPDPRAPAVPTVSQLVTQDYCEAMKQLELEQDLRQHAEAFAHEVWPCSQGTLLRVLEWGDPPDPPRLPMGRCWCKRRRQTGRA